MKYMGDNMYLLCDVVLAEGVLEGQVEVVLLHVQADPAAPMVGQLAIIRFPSLDNAQFLWKIFTFHYHFFYRKFKYLCKNQMLGFLKG